MKLRNETLHIKRKKINFEIPINFRLIFVFKWKEKRGKWRVNEFSQLITLTLFENTFQLMNHNAKVTCWENFRSLARSADSDKLKWANDSRRERPKVVFLCWFSSLLFYIGFTAIFLLCIYVHMRERYSVERFLCLSVRCRFFCWW